MYEQHKNSTNDSMSKKLRTVSWCTGYAGIELGISRIGLGIKPVAFCEIESFAIKNLISKMEQGHLHPTPVWTNCKIFPSGRFCGQVDLFIAGFPCQPFSTAGKRNASDDPRHLFPYVVEGIRGMQPNILFFENVEGILSAKMPGGESVALYVLREMESCGYNVTFGIYSASEVGAPHQRKRVFFMGVKGQSEKYKNLDNKGFEKELKAERLSWNKRKKTHSWFTPSTREYKDTTTCKNARMADTIRDLWSTPTAMYVPQNCYDLTKPIGNGSKFEKKEGQACMQSQTDLQLQTIAWSTPIAGDWKGQKRSEGDASMLCGQVENKENWATPTITNAGDGCDAAEYLDKLAIRRAEVKERGLDGSGRSPDLGAQVQIVNWKSPTASDCQGGAEKGAMQKEGAIFGLRDMVQDEKCIKEPITTDNKLNPRWVESLMGLPRNWVNPGGIVTEWKGWPMGMGKEQHSWEDTRVISSDYKDITNRTDELRLLGNGVVPQCIEKAFAELFMRL